MKMALEEVAAICGGRYDGPPGMNITGVSTDTRGDLRGQLFIPLKGPHFDGHDFIRAAIQNGAAAVLSEREYAGAIRVESTMRALADLAAAYRRRFTLPVIGVTGSAGKTTTKDMIASVLSQKFRTLKTEGNLNNEIGLPQMVFRLDSQHDVAVLEMGMNHKGEIHNLSCIARPGICVITNIGTAHIENLGNRQGILKAKAEIFDGMDPDGVSILNGDDPLLRTLRRQKTIFYGTASNNNVWADNIQEKGVFRIRSKGGAFGARIPLPGKHMILNALAAAAVGLELGLSHAEIQNGLLAFKPSKNRMQILETPMYTILNDVYNANPDSMEAALDALISISRKDQRKVAVLGDMFELGVFAAESHERVGRYAARRGIELLICVGALSQQTMLGFEKQKINNQISVWFRDKKNCAAALRNYLKPNDIILVKGSRGMELETIVNQLSAEQREASYEQ